MQADPVEMYLDKTIDIGAITLAVRTWQADQQLHPPMMLLPATGETAEDWDVVASALSSSRTVHAVNLRGHGASDWPGSYSIRLLADDVIALLPLLGEEPVDLVAHSLGGLVGCLVASSHPDLVHRLVLEDVGILRPRIPSPLARPADTLPFDWRMVEQVRPEIDNPDSRWAAVVAAIAAPTLVIAGGRRSSVPQESVADLERVLPNGRLVTIDAGHLVHATEPQLFIDTVRAYLDAERSAG